MNPIAAELIDRLRNDVYTRRHFDISSWISHQPTNECKTVGCIAGTAVVLSGEYKIYDNDSCYSLKSGSWPRDRLDYGTAGRIVLGIPFERTAFDLFIPWDHHLSILERGRDHFDYLPLQAQPTLDTVDKMVAWAKQVGEEPQGLEITPDRAAFALERITKDEIPYCNWAEAFENA